MAAYGELLKERERASAELKAVALELRDVQEHKDRMAKDLYERELEIRKKQSKLSAAHRTVEAAIKQARDTVPRAAILAVEEYAAKVRKLEAKLNGVMLDLRGRNLELDLAKKKYRPSEYVDLSATLLDLEKHKQEVQDELEEARRDLADRETLVVSLLEEDEAGVARQELAKLKEAPVG